MPSGFEEKLDAYIGREDMSIDELVEGAGELLEEVAPEQTRYKVTERPDVRTIRYYTSQDLLPKPVSYDGGRARYSHQHLLRLLLIKKLQAEHQTLRQIRGDLEGLSEGELIARVSGDPPPQPKATARNVEKASVETDTGRPESLPIRRFELDDGLTVDVLDSHLEDAASRSAVAEHLRALAEKLED